GPKTAAAAQQAAPVSAAQAVRAAAAPSAQAVGLAIQVKAHHNGETFLSKLSVKQNRAIVDFPSSAVPTPQNAGGKADRQRLPDPRVNIQVYGANGALLLKDDNFALNTVFYEPKAEIRVTASRLVPVVPEYSVLVMTPGETVGIDYEMTIYTPDSPDY